ncbi:MAG: hypothetical protein DLM68_17260 [Hyphomicrobiales bacterium]|nr:MAG: hypothetical protein DLM68_17260 [Hyphomicrobiales bacterium]
MPDRAFYFFGLALPLHNRKLRAFNHFLAGRRRAARPEAITVASRCGPLMRDLSARCYRVRPLPTISRGPRAMPMGGLLRPEFVNKPSTE